MTKKASVADPESTLITKRSLQLSLTPPRCPPFGTAQRSALLGTTPRHDPYTDHHDDEEAHSSYNNHAAIGKGSIRERVMHLLYGVQFGIPHPHLSVGPELPDIITRFLGTVLPLSWQNRCRDSGGFRTIADNLVKSSIPLGTVTNPSAAAKFLHLTQKMRKIIYGRHASQFIDMFFPGCEPNEIRGLVFFVHGGAWGSGKPWFYRLTAHPFLEMKLAVAIVGYRTYPCGNVNTQVVDLQKAYHELSNQYPDLCGPLRRKRPIGLCVMGHSSGAHIAFLMIVENIKLLLHIKQSRLETEGRKQKKHDTNPAMLADSFVGISGIYDISHHFDYEAARGVEELSPMKAACGYSREQFRLNSPALRLKDFLISIQECDGLCPNVFFPRSLLVHGIEDDTVPFTATSEGARVIRSCGVTKCEEYYAPLTGHQDAVMHLMLGGRVQKSIVDWLEHEEGPLQVRSRL